MCSASAAAPRDAVLAARDAIARGVDDLVVAFGDTPLISADTLARLRAPLKDGAALAVLGFRAADPTGYGRLLVEGDHLVAIREQADASAAERAITLCNAGVMAFDGRRALAIIDKIGNANSKARVLSDRRRRDRSGFGIGGRRDRNQRG